jgi:hypothetical protein
MDLLKGTKCLFLLFFISFTVYGQNSDNNAVKQEVDKLMGYQASIYNGPKFFGYPSYYKETHPFFNSNIPGIGSIQYDGKYYEGIYLLYDEYKDIVVLSDQSRLIELNTDKITKFTINGSQFVHIDKLYNLKDNKYDLYEFLEDGKIKLFRKEIKSKQQQIINNEFIGVFESKVYYFILLENKLIPITNKKQVFQLFAKEQQGIRRLISKEKLKFRRSKEAFFRKVVAYLNNQQ